MTHPLYMQTLRELSRFFDTERAGRVPFQHEGYDLEPLRRYLAGLQALRPARHVLHVAGTNGKGSVTTVLAALLSASGRSVGSYLSPHLVSYRERILLDGRAVDEATFSALLGRVLTEKPDPGGSPIRSVFEALTAAAALLFRQRGLEAAVFETGLGGRLDATNVLQSSVSVLTPISMDHTEVLGDTLAEIAAEKAGILRPGNPAVIGIQQPEALRVLLAAAQRLGARPVVWGRDFWTEPQPGGFGVVFADGLKLDELCTAMRGGHQQHNAAVALAAYREAAGDPEPGLAREVLASARLAGRLQEVRLDDGTSVVLDGAHNPMAAAALAREAAQLYGKPLALMLGVSASKDVAGVLEPLLPLGDPVLLTSFRSPRAAPVTLLAELAQGMGHGAARAFPGVAAAWRHWLDLGAGRPPLLVTGSLFLVGEMLRLLHGEGRIELDPLPDPPGP
jgi:dihydrofolate synthase / folylpolyglutamate synthase